jgi:hypothetical protein
MKFCDRSEEEAEISVAAAEVLCSKRGKKGNFNPIKIRYIKSNNVSQSKEKSVLRSHTSVKLVSVFFYKSCYFSTNFPF